MSKKSRAIGSLEKRGKYSWRMVVRDGTDSEGNDIRHKKTIKILIDNQTEARKQAEQALSEFVLEVSRGLYNDQSKIKFSDFIERWRRDYANEGNLAPKTLFRYNEMLDGRIIPALGHFKLEEINPARLLDFYNELSQKGVRKDGKYIPKEKAIELLGTTDPKLISLNPRTIINLKKGNSTTYTTVEKISKALKIKISDYFKPVESGKLSDRTKLHHHRLISSILQKAVQWQILADNPAKRVNPPKVDKQEPPHYDLETSLFMLDCLEKEPLKYQAMVNVALYAQFREGEVMGLEWKDLNEKDLSLTVRRASQYLPGRGTYEKDPKNESSKGTVDIPVELKDLLLLHKDIQKKEKAEAGTLWKKSKRMFTTWDGRPMHPYTISKWFLKFRRKYNLPPLTYHGLRHTGITLLLADGADIPSVSRRARHSTKITTMTIYAHAIKSKDRTNSDKLSNMLKRNTNNNVEKPS